MMKYILALIFIVFPPACLAEYVGIFETNHFTIRIHVHCEEGGVSCDDVDYYGKNKTTKKSISLKGQTYHSMCADGVTPCKFLGYLFSHGNIEYFVSDDGYLEVKDNKKIVLHEAGNWHWQ